MPVRLTVRTMSVRTALTAMICATMLLPGCRDRAGQPSPRPDAQSSAQSSAQASAQAGSQPATAPFPAPADYPALTAMLLAAAEPFEALTEAAPDAPVPDLARAIDTADAAARSIHAIVPAATADALGRRLAAARAALGAGQRTDVALAAVEGYRILVTAVPGEPVIPVDVSLLDYAGFRYAADARADPPRWADMERAMRFARDRWTAIRSRSAVAQHSARFEAALDAMDAAVAARDAVGARTAAKLELDMVDVLEKDFAATGQAHR